MNNFSISDKDRLNLKKMINESDDYEDNTDNIRKIKNSVLIKNDILRMQHLKKKHVKMIKHDVKNFDELCANECKFLFDNYTEIFHKILKDTIDLNIMSRLLEVLHKIEEGQMDQQEGSFMVGTILKELYIDSALKTGEKIDRDREQLLIEPDIVEPKQISWKDYKGMK